ncbi:MAG: class I SAM-dependent methyltransferase [Prevotella sp.]|nr:class I SAM-dependent methyltransferase [Alistipes senegalensis]MCM1358286.1 class I SAM-dependent methyltransferase [Prevotella sp.]MCM1473332.1 class I SAM-dependent methyltransferase [Muribaculaceae bacterium]
MSENYEMSVTEQGNPAKPQGSAGEEMLTRMNISHYDVTGWAMDFMELSGNETVLDIGCGGGETLHRMSRKTTAHLTGMDYSPVSVKMTSEHNAEIISSGRMNVIEASVEKMPFDDNSFDRIITVESFYFWKNPPENLKEVHRVLAGNGIFLIVADIHGSAELSDKEIENIKKYNLYNPTPEEFEKLLVNAGFSDVKIHTKSDTKWICAEGRK